MGFRVALGFVKPFLWFLVDFGCGVVVVVVVVVVVIRRRLQPAQVDFTCRRPAVWCKASSYVLPRVNTS